MLGVPAGTARIIIACSGGSDSAAALLAVRGARPRAHLIACYVDHAVRPHASIARDKLAVKAQANSCGAEFASIGLDAGSHEKPSHEKSSPEARLRTHRYMALADFARSHRASIVVTGHQRDDVAESSLMALLRGSGVDGIAAMRPRRPIGDGIDVVRPLLWAPKELLAEYARAKGATISEDETNDDERYRRNAIRRVLRDLESIAPGSRQAIARGAAIANDDKSLLDAVAVSAWRRVRSRDGASLVAAELRRLPDALLRRVLRIEVRRVAGDARDFTFAHCAAIATAVRARRGGSFHAGRAKAELSAGRATFTSIASTESQVGERLTIAAPQKSARVSWHGGTISLRRIAGSAVARHGRGGRAKAQPLLGATVEARPLHGGEGGVAILLDAALLPAGAELTLRSPQAGDRFVPSGRRSAVGLARFLGKSGLPLAQRKVVPLLCKNGSITAAVGVRASAEFAARPGSSALEVRWKPATAQPRVRAGG
ncbi:MAG TPA: tRNA lysidine(34) synthetase TilS [Candidatus Eremiobacteraceae bacterium]|nr:tRNA lysidine(34) synthetase TilS [Candidatus Eremiobacteraceae bacterium]